MIDYAFICNHFPRLEYLFGCYLPRHRNLAHVAPDRVIRKFAFSKPGMLAETVDQLTSLIQYCLKQPHPDDAAWEFLENLDCADHPSLRNGSAIDWITSVEDILTNYLPPAGAWKNAPPYLPEVEPRVSRQGLRAPDPMDTSFDVPLVLIHVLLKGYGPLTTCFPASNALTPLRNWNIELADFSVGFVEPVLLESAFQPLAEVPFIA